MTRLLVFLIIALSTLPARAQEPVRIEPRVELGAGVAVLSRPDYRGSGQVSTTVLPVPYAVYRGERLQASREGVVARLFTTGNFRLGLSASAALPGDDSPVRSGMPELLPTFEIGPSLDWRLGEARGTWFFKLPVRVVAATDLKTFEGIGWLSYPHLNFRQRHMLGRFTLDTSADAGPLWASGKYHRYFYAVEPQFATPSRPAYDVDDGYSGVRFKVFLGLRHGNWRAGLGVTYDTLAGAVFRDSPLVETGHATTIAMGVFYSLWTKDRTVVEDAAP